MDLGIRGRVALVTGGSYGIGRAIALALAENGCHVAICARTKIPLDETAAVIRSKGVEALAIQCNVTVPSDIDHVMQTVVEKWNTVHILVNNAGGVGGSTSAAVEDAPEKLWLLAYEQNALAAVRFTMRAIPLMRMTGWGRVVTVTSVLGRQGGGRPWYNMAKTAETSLMKTLAMDHELVRHGITFNSIAPGRVLFEGSDWDTFRKEDPLGFAKRMDLEMPMGRAATPEEVADIVAYICSKQASFVNGSAIAVDGGESKCF